MVTVQDGVSLSWVVACIGLHAFVCEGQLGGVCPHDRVRTLRESRSVYTWVSPPAVHHDLSTAGQAHFSCPPPGPFPCACPTLPQWNSWGAQKDSSPAQVLKAGPKQGPKAMLDATLTPIALKSPSVSGAEAWHWAGHSWMSACSQDLL
jgi:hypothetical protein